MKADNGLEFQALCAGELGNILASQSPTPPRILVTSKAPARAAVWAQALIDAGCTARPVDYESALTAAYTSDALLILPDALNADFLAAIRSATSGRAFPILCAQDGESPLLDLVDDRLPEQLLPTVAAPRIRSAFRAALAEEEMAARQSLFSGPGWSAQGEDASPFKVLFVGRPSAAYLAVESALSDIGVMSEASPITSAALEYAQEHNIDVVIADAVSSSDDAMRFCLSMRSNAGLHHVPGALLAPTAFGQTTYALTRGISEIFGAEDAPANITRRIVRLAKQKRRFDRMKHYFSTPQADLESDPVTGLFTHQTLARRLQSHIAVAEASARPFSAAILRLVDTSGTQTDMTAFSREIGSLLRRVLRLEDTAGAFDGRTFAILMPASTEAGAKAALTRLCAVLETNALQEARKQWPDLHIETNAAQFNPGEAPGAFLIRAASRSGF